MKNVLIASGVAVLAFVMVAPEPKVTPSRATSPLVRPVLTLVALQTWLIANGYSIPSVSSGAAAKGYFGAQTKAAVKAYQLAAGLPSTGYFGPLTRGKLNGGAVVMTPAAGCPAGYTCTPVGGNHPGCRWPDRRYYRRHPWIT